MTVVPELLPELELEEPLLDDEELELLLEDELELEDEELLDELDELLEELEEPDDELEELDEDELLLLWLLAKESAAAAKSLNVPAESPPMYDHGMWPE